MSEPLISLCMIVGNVEDYIERCLESFLPVSDEIIVVRAIGSATPDKTLDICRDKFGARTAEYRNKPGHETWPHVDDFSAARQMSFDLATGKYCFWCDSDDVLKSGAHLAREHASAGLYDVYVFPYEIFGRGVTVPRERMIRRTAAGRWKFPVHECFSFDQDTKGAADDGVIVEHLPKPSKTGSNERNLRILESIPESEMSPGLWFHLHQELRGVGRDQHSIEAATKAIVHPDCGKPEKYELLLNLATMSRKPDVTRAYLLQAYGVDPQRREALGLMACTAIDDGRVADALALARQMIATERPAAWNWNDRGHAYGWLGVDIFQQCLRASGHAAEAEQIRRGALLQAGGPRIALLHATRGRPRKASAARKLWLDLAEHPERIEHIFAIDEDDRASDPLRRFHHTVVPAGGGCVAAWNAAASYANSEVFVQLSDDWIPPAKWDTLILERLGDVNAPSVLAISDGHRTDKLLCMFICTRAYYTFDWHLFHPDFTGVYSDNYATDIAYARGCVIEARDLVFTHCHPFFTGRREDLDETYTAQNSPERYAAGLATYQRLSTGADWSTVPGFFNFRPWYDQLIAELKDGDTIAEIGVWFGRSIIYLAQRLKHLGKNVRILAVDTFAGEEDQPDHQRIVAEHGGTIRPAFEANLARCGVADMITIMESPSTAAASLVQDVSLAACFIDAAHDRASVRQDIEAWLPKIRIGGMISGHDAQHAEVADTVRDLLPGAIIGPPVWCHRVRNLPSARPVLSILTPAVPSRIQLAASLQEMIEQQITDAGLQRKVEHIVMLDNKTRTVGFKRQALLDAARGDYIAYLDDDDTVSEDYVRSLVEAATAPSPPDVITFRQRAKLDGDTGFIIFDARAATDASWQSGATVIRPPWHICAWRRALVKDCKFPDINDGEDFQWLIQARPLIKTSHHIDKILHTYRFSSEATEATGR